MKIDRMKIHRANRKGLFRYVILGFIIMSLGLITFDWSSFVEQPLLILSLLTPLALLLWIYFDTSYAIDDGTLMYRSGFLRGRIDISGIEEIVRGTTLWVGIKPALAQNGLIIKYVRHRQIYMAPESNQALISDLLERNPAIRVRE